MITNSDPDKIEIYKDPALLELTSKMHLLEAEEINFILSKTDRDENGRTIDDVNADKISVIEATNAHLLANYPNNNVAERFMATNKFLADRLRESIN